MGHEKEAVFYVFQNVNVYSFYGHFFMLSLSLVNFSFQATGYSFSHRNIVGRNGAAVERRTGNREVPGSNLDRCTVIFLTTPTW